MNCRNCLKHLALYAGGDLSREDARAVEAHLADCEDCRVELASYRTAIRALHRAAVGEGDLPDEDESYWLELDAKRRAHSLGTDRLDEKRPAWRRLSSALAQAAVVLIVAGAVIVTQMLPDRQGPTQHGNGDLIADQESTPVVKVVTPRDLVSYAPEGDNTASRGGADMPSPVPPTGVPELPRDDTRP